MSRDGKKKINLIDEAYWACLAGLIGWLIGYGLTDAKEACALAGLLIFASVIARQCGQSIDELDD